MDKKVALVVGGNGIIGKALMEELAVTAGWRARALSRRVEGADDAGLMPAHGAQWRKLAAEQGLVERPYEIAVGLSFGDFVFNAAFDVVSDMGKIRRAGFNETVDSAEALVAAIRRMQAGKILPR